MTIDRKTKSLRDAERFVLQGKIPQAIVEYLKLVKDDPNDVLTLNTVGDLYLRQGKTAEANRLFSQVAEAYARNNFLLKSIAVYKKILHADPLNLEINQTLASLFARQGLNVDARNQYLKVAEICARDGKVRESLDACEKAVEMDPGNSDVQLKLAEAFLVEGMKEKAQAYFAGAGKAHTKAKNYPAAFAAFRRALELNRADIDTLRGFLESAIRTADAAAVIEPLKTALSILPDSVDLREMLGRAHLAAGDPVGAAHAFEMAFSLDESRYDRFFELTRAYVESGDFERAATSLDPIFPKLISKRETDRAVECLNDVLQRDPFHIPTLTKLADIYSAINDQPNHQSILERISDFHLEHGGYKEALDMLEKILQISPESDRHLQLHRQTFEKVFPDTPYTPPVAPAASRPPGVGGFELLTKLDDTRDESAQGASSRFVEIDLLLNYGMADKALEMLLALAQSDPQETNVHLRLFSLYKESGNNAKAAEHGLLVAALENRSGNDTVAQKFLKESRVLDPERVPVDFDLNAFARRQGIEPAAGGRGADGPAKSGGLELDLSGDLSDIFFNSGGEPDAPEPGESAESADALVEEFTGDVPAPKAAVESLDAQLQEVDFYIRLGFAEEAKAKLDEIARKYPDHPELTGRYRQLREPGPHASRPAGVRQSREENAGSGAEDLVIALGGGPGVSPVEPASHPPASIIGFPGQTELPASVRHAGSPPPAPEPAGQVNAMFADLIQEVNDLTDQEITREDFETHFSLGTAYREMGLVDEAISEFQGAMKSLIAEKHPREMIQCCGMLSTCYLEKGMPRSAIRWCQTGLGLAENSSHEALALRYDMGVAHSVTGDSERALECFGSIFRVDPSYRDVAQRIDDLRSGSGRHVS